MEEMGKMEKMEEKENEEAPFIIRSIVLRDLMRHVSMYVHLDGTGGGGFIPIGEKNSSLRDYLNNLPNSNVVMETPLEDDEFVQGDTVTVISDGKGELIAFDDGFGTQYRKWRFQEGMKIHHSSLTGNTDIWFKVVSPCENGELYYSKPRGYVGLYQALRHRWITEGEALLQILSGEAEINNR
jgi:hypothetical protein